MGGADNCNKNMIFDAQRAMKVVMPYAKSDAHISLRSLGVRSWLSKCVDIFYSTIVCTL